MPAEPGDAGDNTQAARADGVFEAVGCELPKERDARWAIAGSFVRYSAFLHLLLVALAGQTELAARLASVAAAAALLLCVVLGHLAGRARLANALTCAVLAVESLRAFPATPNHLYLHAWLAGLLVAGDAAGGGERHNGLLCLRWTYVIVMGWAGLQKALQGGYLSGQYFFYMISTKPSVRDALAWAVPPADVERLVGYGLPSLGDGPYLADAPVVVALANAAWVGEVLVALGVLVARLQVFSAWAAVFLIVAIELLMREFVFGCLAVFLVSLFLPVRIHRRFARALLACMALLAVVRVTWPSWWFN